MSKADIQSITILAIAVGAVITITDEGIAGEAAPTLLYLRGAMTNRINDWPETGDARKNTLLCAKNCRALKDEFDSSAKLYTACCLGMLAQLLLIELRDVVNNKFKLGIIDEFLECINTVVDIYDPKELNDEARDEAERLCLLVKKQIGMG